MSDFSAKGDDLRMIAQALIQARSNIRSAENLLDTVQPYANERTAQELEKMVVDLQSASSVVNAMYKRNAKEAFGDGNVRPT